MPVPASTLFCYCNRLARALTLVVAQRQVCDCAKAITKSRSVLEFVAGFKRLLAADVRETGG